MKFKILLSFLFFILLSTAFLFFILPGTALPALSPSTEVQLAQAYQSAVRDASITEAGENSSNLIAITKDNTNLVWNEVQTKILVVTWKAQDSYQRFFKDQTQTSTNEAFVVWATTVPQVQQFCQQYMQNNPNITEEQTNLRLKQYLGLDFSWQYDVFVEMWVSPEELFRPCVDPEITDSQCHLAFSNAVPMVKNLQNYPLFYKNLYFNSFRNKPGVPWTGLGYTYDWGNPLTDEGPSEFIMIPGATFEINQAVATMDYCSPPLGEN